MLNKHNQILENRMNPLSAVRLVAIPALSALAAWKRDTLLAALWTSYFVEDGE